MKKKKRVLALALSFLMIWQMLPVNTIMASEEYLGSDTSDSITMGDIRVDDPEKAAAASNTLYNETELGSVTYYLTGEEEAFPEGVSVTGDPSASASGAAGASAATGAAEGAASSGREGAPSSSRRAASMTSSDSPPKRRSS